MTRCCTDRIAPSEITPEAVWEQRRAFLRLALAASAGLALPDVARGADEKLPAPIQNLVATDLGKNLKPTSREAFTTYNNFVELGPDKEAPAKNAHLLRVRPWIVRVDGECESPGEIGIEEILSSFPQEERVYRFRCVETWAAVVPWVGVPLRDFLARFKPTSKAKYVAFQSVHDVQNLPGQRRALLPWPYVEGLRIDEATHPLTLLATGCYGRELPGQNGAPVRLVVPWKYGFKSAKSLVRVTFTETRPATTWERLQPDEYGFYANVNPTVDHPRWSQKRERPLGGGLFAGRQHTLMYNGYEAEVAGLYAGMDLARHY